MMLDPFLTALAALSFYKVVDLWRILAEASGKLGEKFKCRSRVLPAVQDCSIIWFV